MPTGGIWNVPLITAMAGSSRTRTPVPIVSTRANSARMQIAFLGNADFVMIGQFIHELPYWLPLLFIKPGAAMLFQAI